MANGFDLSMWQDMMADSVSIYPFVSYSVSGVPTYSVTPAVYPAYIRMENHRIIDGKGREISARGWVYLGLSVTGTVPVVSTLDKLVLPVSQVPNSPPIIAVNSANDELGAHHVVLHIG